MPESPLPGDTAQPLCPSSALAERGRAWVFDVRWHGERTRAFALRIDGRVHGYLNRCAHVPAEMDWQPGEFLDVERRWIVCSLHGAMYEPASGVCISGPCIGKRLVPLDLREHDGRVAWYPSEDVEPASA